MLFTSEKVTRVLVVVLSAAILGWAGALLWATLSLT
jgi:ABC-type branched-subunit amino acid transport system permease subunit